jgi:hypothetical protein
MHTYQPNGKARIVLIIDLLLPASGIQSPNWARFNNLLVYCSQGLIYGFEALCSRMVWRFCCCGQKGLPNSFHT